MNTWFYLVILSGEVAFSTAIEARSMATARAVAYLEYPGSTILNIER